MSKKGKAYDLLSLFWTFFCIGLFTFGGGYAMLPLIEKKVVEDRKWLSQSELIEMLAISESTPGPVSVNVATFVGYKIRKIWGAFFATFGLVIPSFTILLIISYFYKEFIEVSIISSAFKGIRIAVIILLFRAVIKLKGSNKFDFFSSLIFAICLSIILCFNIFNIKIMFGNFQFSISLLLIFSGIIFAIIEQKIRKGADK